MLFGTLFPTTFRNVWNHSPDNIASRDRRSESLLNTSVSKVPIPMQNMQENSGFPWTSLNRDLLYLLMQCCITELEARIEQVIITFHFLLVCNDNRHGILDMYCLLLQCIGLHARQFQ